MTAPRASARFPITELTHSHERTPQLGWNQFSELLHVHLREQNYEISAREKIALISCAAILSASHTAENEKFVSAFLVHVALLEHTNLVQRSFPRPAKEANPRHARFFAEFSYIAIDLIQHWRDSPDEQLTNRDIFDLVDGRLYRHVFDRLDSINLIVDVGPYARCVRALVGVHVLTTCSPAVSLRKAKQLGSLWPRLDRGTEHVGQMRTVLPFSHPVLDKYLSEVRLETDSVKEPKATSRIFHELTHWHNAKRPLDPKQARQPLGFHARKRNQKFMADTIAYSASLTNASGKNIDPEIIVTQVETARQSAQRKNPKPQYGPRPSKTKKEPSGRQAALDAAKALQAKKLKTKSSDALANWDRLCGEFERERDLVKRYIKVSRYFQGVPTSDRQVVEAEVLLYLCNTLALLRSSPGYRMEPRGLSILALAWAHARELLNFPMNTITGVYMSQLAGALGLPVSSTAASSVVRKLPFKMPLADLLLLPAKTAEFRLEHCGPYLERSFDSRSDTRVPFHPDAWQREVLDAIDQNKSLFVVAPTSAGKTFISFYAMKKVLLSSDSDILVYVAPTKALVNQIAAEIQARFSKSYRQDGRSVSGDSYKRLSCQYPGRLSDLCHGATCIADHAPVSVQRTEPCFVGAKSEAYHLR